jgi:hypothetical protein
MYMKSVEWPIAAETADHRVEPVRAAGRDRLPVVRHDLFLDDRARLTEQERALMSAMLIALIEQIADEIRLGLPADLVAQAETDRDRIAPLLWKKGALDRPALILLLLRRADEQLIEAACRGARGPGEGGTVERLVGDGDGAIASAAMALAVARGRRRDRFGRLGIEFDDIPLSEAAMLVHLVAATMRSALDNPSVAVDEAIAAAAERLIDRHDESRRVETRALQLAEALIGARGEDDGLIAALATEGDAGLLAALCALRAGIAPESAWMLLVDDGARDAMLLARLAGIERPAAAAMVAALAEPLLWGEPGQAIACFDVPTAADIDAARRWWRLPVTYREVFNRGAAHGHPID